MAVDKAVKLLDWVDHLVMAFLLGINMCVGIYYGCFGSKQSTDGEYLRANRNMKALPVAASLIGGYISGITILSTPAEIYIFGTQYYAIVFSIIAMAFSINYVFLPVFISTGVKSAYEYLQIRFRHRAVRTVSSLLFVMDETLTIPLYMYMPSLALEQVTTLNRLWTAPIAMLFCIVYTGIGGLKAVIWTDALQITVFILALLVIFIVLSSSSGGFSSVFYWAQRGGRLELFNLDPNPLTRTTLWGALFGGYMYWTGFNSVNQTMLQRYLAVPDLQTARRAVWIFTAGVLLVIHLCVYIGLLMYNYYRNCDPFLSGRVSTSDQLVAFFVVDAVGSYRGLPGLFVAGIYSAALSSISVSLNSTSGVVLDDLWRAHSRRELSPTQAGWFAKISCAVYGMICVVLMMALENAQHMMEVTMALTGIAAGIQFGIFCLGMFNPWANYKGAIAGAGVAVVIVGWLVLGAQIMSSTGHLYYPHLPTSVANCSFTFPTHGPEPTMDPDLVPAYRLSYLWISPIGWFLVMLVGTVVSLLTGPDDADKADPVAFNPCVASWLRRRQSRKGLGTSPYPEEAVSTRGAI